MSETTTSAPADSGAAPAPETAAPVVRPPTDPAAAISISEAARLLSNQRRQGKDGGDAPAQREPARRPSPNDAAAAAAKPPEAPKAEPATKAADSGLSALERALGVPPGEAPDASRETPPDAAGTIEIEGQRYTQAQLREAVLKAGDYTKKTQAIAEQQRALQQQQEALATVLPYIQPELAKLAQVVQSEVPRPDISLMQTDPGRYFQELHAYEALREEQQRLGSITTLQSQAQERAMAQQVAAANEQLAAEFPFWKNEADRTAVQQQIVEWATTKGGFQRDELRGLTDPRALKAMMKSMLFDRWVAGTKTQAPAATTSAPARGTPPPAPPTERIQVATQAFEEKPNVRNATALLSARRAAGNGMAR